MCFYDKSGFKYILGNLNSILLVVFKRKYKCNKNKIILRKENY